MMVWRVSTDSWCRRTLGGLLLVVTMVVGLIGGKGYASCLQAAHPTRDTVNSATNARTDFNMTYEQLLELDFDELMALADKYGVSLDELMQMPFDVQTSSASKKEESVFDSPLSISVLTKEQIRLSGATSIPELLRRIPGVIVREQTPGVFDLHLRGLDNVPPGKFSHFANNSLTLVMVDGVPYYNYTMGGTFWESLPVSLGEIEHIDIIRGASSALYGASAVSGVVNIVTGNTSNQLTATADARTYLQDMKFGAHLVGHVQVPLYKQLRLAVSQSYTLRRVNNYDAYSFANGRYEPYAGLTGLNGKPYYNPGEFIGISTSVLLFNGMRSMDAHVVSAQLDYMGYKFKGSVRGGYQRASTRAVFMENYVTPFAIRFQESGFAQALLSFYGVRIQAGYSGGVNDMAITQRHPTSKSSFQQGFVNVDYAYRLFGQLTVQPTLSYLHAVYDDRKWDAQAKRDSPTVGAGGTLGGHWVTSSTIGAALRLDWQPLDLLRVVGAARIDKFNVPNKVYPSYQFAVTVKPHRHHLLRVLFARANRSPFIADTYLNYRGNPVMNYGAVKKQKGLEALAQMVALSPVPVQDEENVVFQNYSGNPDLSLLRSHQAELGYRMTPVKQFALDLEVFGSYTTGFADMAQIGVAVGQGPSETDPTVMIPRVTQTIRYENLPMKVWQYGATLSLFYTPIPSLRLNYFVTVQRTDLKKHVQTNFLGLGGEDPTPLDIQHDWTPTANMGLLVDYTLLDKYHFSLEGYFRTKQVYRRGVFSQQANAKGYGIDEIPPYGFMNATFTWDASRHCALQFSARNLFYHGREFGFADSMQPLWALGLQLNL